MRSRFHLARMLGSSLLIAALSLGAGCAVPVSVTQQEAQRRLWPDPPEVPRISFEAFIAGPKDVGSGTGAIAEFLAYLTGRPQARLINPNGVAVDAERNLYVVDGFAKNVHVFNRAGKSYVEFPMGGTQFTSPVGIAIDDKRQRIYVSDSAEAIVKVFDKAGGKPVYEIRSGGLGRPTGVAVNRVTDELLVIDTVNATILRFALSDHALKGVIGREGVEAGRFHSPTHLAVSPAGLIFVTDSLNFRVQVLSPDGRFVRAFGAAGDGPGYFARPKGVALDSDGNVYVVDALFDNVQMFDQNGTLLMSFGKAGDGTGEFWLPSGISIDADDMIYVADSYNRRVQVFRYLADDRVPK